MSKYKTAMGQIVDMDALAAKNELIRAVSNRSVNARGDLIDEAGKVIKPATELANEAYAKTVGNKSAQVKSKPVSRPAPAPKIEEELSDLEKELDSNLDEELEIERIKAEELKKKK